MTLYECLKKGFETGDYSTVKEEWLDQNFLDRLGQESFSKELGLIDYFLKNKVQGDFKLLGPWADIFKRGIFKLDQEAIVYSLEVLKMKKAIQSLKMGDKETAFQWLDDENLFKRSEKLKTLSLAAAEGGKLDILKELLKKGAKINPLFFENKEQTLLMAAAKGKQAKVVEFLLQQGAKAYFDGWQSEFMYKAHQKRNDYQKMTEILFEYGDLVALKEEKKESKLVHKLIYEISGFSDVFDVLKKNPLLSLDVKNEHGYSFLEEALITDDRFYATRALWFGASLQYQTKEGISLLEKAIMQDKDWFLDCYEDKNDLISEGNKLFEEGLLNFAIKQKSTKVAYFLVKAHIGLEDKDKDNKTPLMNAALWGEWITDEVAKRTKNLNQVDSKGQTALFYAVQSNQAFIVRRLLKRNGVSLNHQDEKGNTALMNAVMQNNLEMIKILLQAGADVMILNDEGKDAFHFAMNRGYVEAASLIKEKIKKNIHKQKMKSASCNWAAIKGNLFALNGFFQNKNIKVKD